MHNGSDVTAAAETGDKLACGDRWLLDLLLLFCDAVQTRPPTLTSDP